MGQFFLGAIGSGTQQNLSFVNYQLSFWGDQIEGAVIYDGGSISFRGAKQAKGLQRPNEK
jgi:hypothetical protein